MRESPLTPSYAVVELKGGGGVEYAGGEPGVEVDSLDEHPEDGGQVPEHQAGQDHAAHPGLRYTAAIV